MKKILFILMLITSCICLSCNNSNREIIYSYVNGYGDAHLTLGNVGGWGAEVKSHEYKNGIGKITFKSTITSIPEFAFINSTILKSITIPNSVTRIENEAFRRCENLESITIPNNVTKIGDGTFSECKSLKNINIPKSVTKIGNNAFYDCHALRSVTIPNSVTEIGDGVFRGCGNLSTVYCNATTPPNGGCLMFSYYKYNYEHFSYSHTEHKNLKCKIYVPTASVSAYKTAKNWSDYADNIVGYDF